MEEILKLVTEKSGLGADKLRSVVQTILGFLRSKVPANMAGQFDTALGTTAPPPAEAGDVLKAAEAAGLSAGQIKSVFDTVLTFLKNKLPADLSNQLSSQLTGLLSSGGGLFQKVAAMFTGK